MSKKRASQANPKPKQILTRTEWDLKLASILFDKLVAFYNPIQFTIPELTKDSFYCFVLDAKNETKTKFGPRPEEQK